MKYFKCLVAFSVALFSQSFAFAQNPWSLEQCVKYALDHNINIQQQQLQAEQSANTLFQSKFNFLPSVNANVSYRVGWGTTETRVVKDSTTTNVFIDNTSQSITPSIYASINLFEGLRKIHTLNKNKADYNAAQQEVENLRNNISIEVARAYLQVLLSKEVLATAKKSLESVEEQLAITRKLVEAGSQPYSNQLEIEAQLASEQVQLITAQNQVEVSYLTLCQWIGVHRSSAFEIETPSIDIAIVPASESVDNLYDLAQRLPQIQIVEYRKESAKHAHSIAKSRFWPTLSFSASYGSGAYYSSALPSVNFWDQINQNVDYGFSFGLNIPIFQNWNIVTGAKNAKLNYKIAALEVERRHDLLYKEIQQVVLEASAAYNKYKAGDRNVTATEESFRYTQQKFEIGSATSTDYNVAKNNLFKAQSNMLQAKYQYVFQLKILDFYKGNPFTL